MTREQSNLEKLKLIDEVKNGVINTHKIKVFTKNRKILVLEELSRAAAGLSFASYYCENSKNSYISQAYSATNKAIEAQKQIVINDIENILKVK